MSIEGRLFGPVAAPKVFGEVAVNRRYHMPLLPGEQGVKSGGDWVPGGITRTTNLIGAFTESRALNIWEQEQLLIGLVKAPSLYEELTVRIHQEELNGVDFSRLRDFPELRVFLSGSPQHEDECIVGRAKQAAGANEARQAGTNRHTAWEVRLATGELIGTPGMQSQILSLEALLKEKGLERIPHLSERTIRNTTYNCAGRFDDILLETATGRLLIADYKSKKRKFFSWLETDAQLAIYASAQYMVQAQAWRGYEDGPARLGVDQTEGVVLHVPSNGDRPYLRRADLQRGRQIAELARKVVDERAYGKSAERHALSEWIGNS
jgi:hypothetical protein